MKPNTYILSFFLSVTLLASCNLCCAQTGSNPIFRNSFTADPAPLVYNGRLYVYVGKDEAKDGELFTMTAWLCYSTTDMINWTSHGSVMKPTDFKWAAKDAWASQVVHKNGKFYLYVTVTAAAPNSGRAIGVAVSDSPTGPFVDARGSAIVYDKTTPSQNAWDDIDPTVLIDDDGSAYLCWGNPNCYFAKLKPNMTEIDGAIKTITPPNYGEGPWLHKRNGLYYLTYAAFVSPVGSEQICYATATSINGPWTYRGILTGTAKNSYTIHPGIVEYSGQSYLFYHNATLTLNGQGPALGRRSVCVDYLCYNTDGTMKSVTQTTAGVTVAPPCPSANIVVSITAPTNNAVYTEGDNITITANATISTGSISKVDFYNGTTLLGTDASSPYTYTISAAAAGAYTITAKATSAANASTTSTAINIQVAKPVYQTGSAPTIDGTIDPLWSNFNAVGITRLVNGTVSSTADLSGNWKAAWDATNLYVLVQVTDDIKRNDAGTDVYNDDNVEIYVDMGNTKATTYGTNDHQYTFRWNDATAAYEINGHPVTGIIKGITNTTTGYIVEVSIPWTTMGGTAAANSFQGFDVMINDDDDGAARDGKLAWAATTDDTWSNPALMGTIVLKGLNCTAPAAAITATGTTTFCAGGSVVLNAGTGTGYTYVWKNGTTAITGATAATYTASTAGNYSVTITNTGGCSATSTATTVTVNAVPAITLYGQVNAGAWNQTASSALCPAGTIVVGPQPNVAAGWSWTGPNGYSASTREITIAAITATQAGSYTATYTDANSCKATAVYNITVNAAPAATINTTTPTSFCTGGSVVLTASAGSSYIWKNGNTQVGTGASYTATTAGSYTVEVTNASGCKATSTATTVTVNTAPTATITANGPTTMPQGASVELAANTGSGLSYKWFNGTTQVGTASTYTATTAGTYTVQVTNQNCSATSAETTVTLQPNQSSVITITSPTQNATLPGTITITADITDADGNIVLVEYLDGDEVIGTSTTAPYSFEWNNPAEGNHVISIRVKDSNGGITTSAPVTITSQSTSTGLYGSNTNTLNGNVYPNPANGIVWIESDTDLSNANFMLVDVLGNEHPLSQTANGAGAQIDVSNLSEGAYVLIIKKDTSVLRKKITVIR